MQAAEYLFSLATINYNTSVTKLKRLLKLFFFKFLENKNWSIKIMLFICCSIDVDSSKNIRFSTGDKWRVICNDFLMAMKTAAMRIIVW
jgi:hypothetical protein